MESVTRIGFEFYGDSTDICFSSLEELSLSDFPNLETWSSANNENAFPSLRKLTINRCPKLTHIPFCLSLQHLELRDCNPSSIFIGGLTLLTVLVLEKLPELRSLPPGLSASNLSSLEVLSCPKLCSLPLEIGNLTALKSLTIRWCDELSSLPESLQNLKALESLEISDCHSIISMPDGAIGVQFVSPNSLMALKLLSKVTDYNIRGYTKRRAKSVMEKFFEGINALPALTSLKLLELEVNADSFYHHDFQLYSKLSRLATLIKASPHLQRLVLKLCFYPAEDRDTEYLDKRMPMKLEKAPKWPHHCLKVVEIIGYRGRPHIVEYVMDLVENAVALEKIVIDPIEPENWSCYHTIPDRRVEKSKKARDHAMHQLKRMVPSTIEFVCL
ncbi:probable disease resistance protein At5g66900 [Rosa rugosa]|uniref:probable disease resistance protein At5g66900 n=1 Tax=Rosa rugosa TaxID=74645 RepID=UPI002B4048EA|nr:probable disease resistance protein At5g66900 [Rosa rugosa]